MATGYVLVLSVLILGGVIATLGDRIGMRVGKARLSLFNLRPRQTATVVSILTGGVISASTLALLFGVSQQLRTGVFELERIQEDLSEAEQELEETRTERTNIEAALSDARQEQTAAQDELQTINQFLQSAVEQQRTTQAELQQSRGRLEELQSQLARVSQQSAQLQDEIQRLEAERADLLEQQATVQERIAERDRLIAQRDQDIAQRDQDIAQRDQDIAQRETRLKQLQRQQTALQEDVEVLERQYQGLFRGSVAVGRNEPLVSVLLRVNQESEARRAVDQLLQEANRAAIAQIAPGIDRDQPVLRIPSEDVERLLRRISDGQSYVVRVLSSANYIIGEPCVVADDDPCVQVFIDAAVNEIIYEPGERLATVTVDPRNLTNQELVEKLNLLIASLQFRARQDGLIGDTLQVANGRTEALLAFLQAMRNLDAEIDIQAIASEPIPTIGPLQVELFAVDSNGEVLLRTDELPQTPLLEGESRDPRWRNRGTN